MNGQGDLTPMTQAVLVFFAYVVGTIPLAAIVVRLVAGSKKWPETELGWDAIEVTRAFGLWPAGIVVMALTFLRGGVIAYFLSPVGVHVWASALGWELHVVPAGLCWMGAFALLMGECFTPFRAFKGGRGIEGLLGVLTALSPWAALASVAGFGLAYLKTTTAELASLTGLMVATVVHLVLIRKGTPEWVGILILGLIFFRHHLDLDRLLQRRSRAE